MVDVGLPGDGTDKYLIEAEKAARKRERAGEDG
jgi:hypothetical protein